jgi:hypothetical protein
VRAGEWFVMNTQQGLGLRVYSLGIIPKAFAAAALDDLTLVSTLIDSANRRRPANQRTRKFKHACSYAHTHYVLASVFSADCFVLNRQYLCSI